MAAPEDPTTEFRTRYRQQAVVAELGQRALSTDDPDGLFREATTAVGELLEAEYCDVFELGSNGRTLSLRQGVGWRDGVVGSATVPTGRDSQAGYTLQSGATVVVEDFETEERFAGSNLLDDHDVASGVTAIVGSVDEPWGVFGVHATERREFTEREVAVVQRVANLLGAAISNVERDERLREENERLRTENERVREENERLDGEKALKDRLVEASPVGIMHVDADDEIRFANERAEEIHGRNRDELVAESNDDPEWNFVDADGNPLSLDRLPSRRVIEGEESVEGFEMGIDRPDGERVWLSVDGEALRDDDGTVTGAVLALEDVTERERYRRESQRVYRALETASEGIGLLDGDGDFAYVNRAYAGLYGYEPAELVGEHWDRLYPEDEAEAIVREAPPALEETGTWSGETVGLRKDGSEFVEDHRLARTDDGGLVCIVRDVTERERMRDELREERTLKEQILETSPVGITLIDADGTNVFANERAETILGRTLEELRSYVHDDDRWNLVDGDGEPLSGEKMPFSRVQETGEPVYDEVLGIDHPGGTRVWIEAHCAPLFDANGAFDGAVYALKDVTRRKARERALEESERRYRTLLEHFPNGAVALFDDALGYTLVGGQLLGDLGVDPDEIVGESVHERYPEEMVERVEPHFRAAFDGEERTFEEERYGRHLLAQTLPVRNGDGEIFAGMLVIQDVTEREENRQRLEELVAKLEESNERLEQFAYAASHDLQEPLRMVSSYLQLLERRYADDLDEAGLEFLAFAVDGADRMREMIEGLLTYSRIDTRGEPFESVDCEEIVADVRQDLRLQIEETDAEFTIADLPTVRGDAGQLRQLFANLLSNAVKYAGDEPPCVHVSAEKRVEPDAWEFAVRDEGIGIESDESERIFEVFNRLHSIEQYPGTGIGLALCQRIVERHGGEIWVDSVPGEGSTFRFTLDAEIDPVDLAGSEGRGVGTGAGETVIEAETGEIVIETETNETGTGEIETKTRGSETGARRAERDADE